MMPHEPRTLYWILRPGWCGNAFVYVVFFVVGWITLDSWFLRRRGYVPSFNPWLCTALIIVVALFAFLIAPLQYDTNAVYLFSVSLGLVVFTWLPLRFIVFPKPPLSKERPTKEEKH